MPLDLNTFDLEKLTERVAALLPGQSLMSNDGLIIRRRANTTGFDTGIGAGGYGSKRINTAALAAEDMLTRSAKYEHPSALGGAQSFLDYDTAIQSVRKGEATPSGPSPAVKALRAVSTKATLASYRTRAQKARTALAKGDVATALRNLEAIVQHAHGNGNTNDAKRAETALSSIRDNHDFDSVIPVLQHTKIEIRTIGSDHFVYRNGRQVTEALTRQEAQNRRKFLARKAAQEEDTEAIDNEINGVPNLVKAASEGSGTGTLDAA